MLEMKLDEAGLASARFVLIEMPLCDREQNTVERIGTRLDAGSGRFLSEHSTSSLNQAIEEVAATSRLPKEHARAALLYSTAHTGYESPFEMDNPEPVFIEAHPLLEMRAEEAQAKQRAYELSKVLSERQARVIESDGEVLAVYRNGALYSPETGEQLTPAC